MSRKWAFDAEAAVEHIVSEIKTYFLNNGPDSKAVIGISGGKDSTIVAALCVRALGADRVFGVKMPQYIQSDISDSDKVIDYLGIDSVEINIGEAVDALYNAIGRETCNNNSQITTNTPARLRMTTLYAVAAQVGGRVMNTCNRSEDYVGYSTKYGDSAGDFGILAEYTVREVLLIGECLNLPAELIHKAPADGMCGKTDEDNLGFTYETLDAYLLEGIQPDYDTYKRIEQLHQRNRHKTRYMPTISKTQWRLSF